MPIEIFSPQFASYVGVAFPLVAILVYLLWQSNQERRETTGRFLDTLQQTIQTNAAAMIQHTVAVTEMKSQASVEHRDMVAEMRNLIEVLKELKRQ